MTIRKRWIILARAGIALVTLGYPALQAYGERQNRIWQADMRRIIYWNQRAPGYVYVDRAADFVRYAPHGNPKGATCIIPATNQDDCLWEER